MTLPLKRIFTAILALSVLSVVSVPGAAEAATKKVAKKTSFQAMMYNPNKTYKDEKVTITNPTSRCITKATKASHDKSIKQGEEDAKKLGITASTTGALAEDYTNYKSELGLAWEAMNQPYCGFGAFGTGAAVKSYNKSVERARGRFLAAVKKSTSETKKPVVEASVLVNMVSTTETQVPNADVKEPADTNEHESEATSTESVTNTSESQSHDDEGEIPMSELLGGFMH